MSESMPKSKRNKVGESCFDIFIIMCVYLSGPALSNPTVMCESKFSGCSISYKGEEEDKGMERR